jgi:GDP-4-dehydro-6-deoxy-D-mannose reductase
MKTVLVTGASGFVGTHFINSYADDYKILALWNSTPITGTKALSLKCDLTKVDEVKQLLTKTTPDVILHLAGKAKTHNEEFNQLMNDNVVITRDLLNIVAELKEKTNYNPKIIIISSAEVYGNTPNPKSVTEDAPFFPLTEYGLSKILADRMAYWFAQVKKLNVIILRSFNHTGPGQKLGFFVSDMASQIVKIEKGLQTELEVGNLSSTRDLLDVRDVIKAYKLAIDKNLESGEVFNVCSGKGLTMEHILKRLCNLSNAKINVIQKPSKMRTSDNPILIGNNTKFKNATKWKQTISLDQTLKDCLSYWRSKD